MKTLSFVQELLTSFSLPPFLYSMSALHTFYIAEAVLEMKCLMKSPLPTEDNLGGLLSRMVIPIYERSLFCRSSEI